MATYRLFGGPGDGSIVEIGSAGPPSRIAVPLRTQVPSVTGWPSWVVMPFGTKDPTHVARYEWSGTRYRHADMEC